MGCSPISILTAVLLAGAFSLSPANALTFDAWQATKFSAGQLAAPAISGPNADPDGDGRGNLTEYTYRVSAVQGEYASDPSNEFTITTPLDTDGDGIPDAMEATYGTDPMAFSSGNNGIPDGWWISYGLSPYSSTTQDTDGDGRTDVQEYFDGTNPLVFDSAPTSPAPLAPSDLILTTLDNGHNELTWTNNGTPAGIIIERKGGTTWQTVGIVSGSETTFTDATSLPGIVYVYRVKAYN